jgi:hypothetical protein
MFLSNSLHPSPLKRGMSITAFSWLKGIGHERQDCNYVGDYRDLRVLASAMAIDSGIEEQETYYIEPLVRIQPGLLS